MEKNKFKNVGRYWYTDGKDALDLGICHSQEELDRVVQDTIDIGTNGEIWDGWYTSYEPTIIDSH